MKTEINLTKSQFDDWLAALRSGKFKQGIGRLKQFNPDSKETSYCCLGVLCETNGLQEQISEQISKRISGTISLFISSDMKYGSGYLYPSNLVSSYDAGLRDPYVDISNMTSVLNRFDITHIQSRVRLSTLNDTYKVSFVDIADIIENNFEPKE